MRIIAILLCGALAACSQTGASQTTSSAADQPAKPSGEAGGKADSRQAAAGDKCQQAVARVQQQQMNSAMLGGALSMVGGLGGLAGRGGAVAAQAVSVGSSVAQAQAQNSAQDAIQQDCLS